MSRILYTAFDVIPSPKGASTHVTHFVRGLVAAGHEVDLLTPGDGVLPAQGEFEGAAILRTPPPATADGNFLARAVAFSQAVTSHLERAPAYDIVHYRSVWGGLQQAQAKARYGYKTLFEVNGLPSVELKYHYPSLPLSAAGRTLLAKIREQELATLALSDAIVCPSGVTQAFLVSLGVAARRITVIPNGVSTRDFAPAPWLERPGEPPVILYLGTLADWQGLTVLIDAVAELVRVQPVRLQIVGRGRSRQRKQLARQIRKARLEGCVTVEAAVPHHAVPALIAGADYCVAPLAYNDRNVTQGCCPIKVLEYMAAGRALVAANLPVVRELVREDVDGLLFNPDDPVDLARQLQRLLADRPLAASLAARAAARAADQFTWHAAQKKLLKVYAGLLADH